MVEQIDHIRTDSTHDVFIDEPILFLRLWFSLELFDLATCTTRRVAELGVPPGPPGISVSPDGRWVVYARGEGEYEADIILVENFE